MSTPDEQKTQSDGSASDANQNASNTGADQSAESAAKVKEPKKQKPPKKEPRPDDLVRLKCTLQNCADSSVIGSTMVKWEQHREGKVGLRYKISEEIPRELADSVTSIPGFSIVE